MKILISGGTGLIGNRLIKELDGHEIFVLSRQKDIQSKNYTSIWWNIESEHIDSSLPNNIDVIIHLAGAGVADKRWTSKRKKEILESRTKSASVLYKYFKDKPPKVFITASGINYYGTHTSDKIYTEKDKSGKDFLASICVEWEKSVNGFEDITRLIKLRIGMVLSPNGGALSKISKPIKLGIGSALGSGKQWIPWIHIDDLCSLIKFSISNEKMEGNYNAIASEHINNKTLIRKIANFLNKRIILPNIPSFILKLVLGEMSKIILEGSRASNKKILDTGFEFKYNQLEQALENIYPK